VTDELIYPILRTSWWLGFSTIN